MSNYSLNAGSWRNSNDLPPDLVRYKGRHFVGSHTHTFLSYKVSQIVFTVENGLLTVAITGRLTQRFPAREILDYLGFDTSMQVEESVVPRYGGGITHIYQQAIS